MYELVYFNLRGRGEVIHWIFTVAQSALQGDFHSTHCHLFFLNFLPVPIESLSSHAPDETVEIIGSSSFINFELLSVMKIWLFTLSPVDSLLEILLYTRIRPNRWRSLCLEFLWAPCAVIIKGMTGPFVPAVQPWKQFWSHDFRHCLEY